MRIELGCGDRFEEKLELGLQIEQEKLRFWERGNKQLGFRGGERDREGDKLARVLHTKRDLGEITTLTNLEIILHNNLLPLLIDTRGLLQACTKLNTSKTLN